MLVGKESECEGGCALEGDLGGSVWVPLKIKVRRH